MSRGRTKKKPHSKLSIFLLLLKLALVKIGNIPLLTGQKILQIPVIFWDSIKGFRFQPGYFLNNKFKVMAIVVLIFISLADIFIHTLPDPLELQNSPNPLATEIYDRSGIMLYKLYGDRDRTLTNIDDLPPYVWEASIAVEDKNFWWHPGVDPEALLRAVTSNLSTGSMQGGSTITQQLIKNTLLTPEKTYARKTKEIALALWTERLYSKKQILEMYLNEAPYGGATWGIESASETYFGKSAKDLTLGEAAYLAGLPASPTQYSPRGANPELGLDRQKLVLERMAELGFISYDQAVKALETPLAIKPDSTQIRAPHFVMYVKDLLIQKYGAKKVMDGGLKVYTSLDYNLQQKIESIVKAEISGLSYLNVQNGASMIVDGKTGQILAMVGSKDYYDLGFGNYNSALALRQPGSSIKVVTYATGFKMGYTPGNTILDMPVSFPDGDKKYSPVNYDSRFHGPVSVRTALGSSYNIPAVKMLATVGLNNMIQTAREMGITTFTDPHQYGLSLTLGGGEVRMIDMMSVYTTLSQLGTKKAITPILKITDSYGNVLEQYQDQSTDVLKPEIAYMITNILSDDSARTPAFGPHSLLYIPDHQVAVKTGTSDNKRDNWTFGYTPNYVVGVWVGNNDNTPMNPALTSGVTGAAPIWNKIMHTLLDNQSSPNFEKPSGIVDATVDGRKDLGIAGEKPKTMVQFLNRNNQYTFIDPYTSFSTPSASMQPH